MPNRTKPSRFAVIIPVCNEAESIGVVVAGLREELPKERFAIAIGLNGTQDASGEIASKSGADFVGESDQTGYGHGCVAAINALPDEWKQEVDGFIFFAGDGANDPTDVSRLVQTRSATGAKFVIGLRRFDLGTWREEFGRALPNLLLGVGVFFLTGRFFHDLGPLRLIEADLFRRMNLREYVWGWTIEAQVMAARLSEEMVSIPVVELPRIAGDQKVSGVSTWRSLKIGLAIFAAGIRTRLRPI